SISPELTCRSGRSFLPKSCLPLASTSKGEYETTTYLCRPLPPRSGATMLAVNTVVDDPRSRPQTFLLRAVLQSHRRILWNGRDRVRDGFVLIHRCRGATSGRSASLAAGSSYLRSRRF